MNISKLIAPILLFGGVLVLSAQAVGREDNGPRINVSAQHSVPGRVIGRPVPRNYGHYTYRGRHIAYRGSAISFSATPLWALATAAILINGIQYYLEPVTNVYYIMSGSGAFYPVDNPTTVVVNTAVNSICQASTLKVGDLVVITSSDCSIRTIDSNGNTTTHK